MTEDQGASPDTPRPTDPNRADAPATPHAHPGAPQWEAPGSSSGSSAAVPPLGGPAPGPGAAPGYHGKNRPELVNEAPSFKSWQPGIIPLRPLSFGDFLTVPFKALRFNRAVVLGAPVLFTLISTVLTLVALWLVFTDPQLGILNNIPDPTGISGSTLGMIVVSLLAILLADVLSGSVIAPGVARAVMGERITIASAWRQVRKRLGSLFLLYVATSVSISLLIALTMSPILLAVATGGEPHPLIVFLAIALFLLVMLPAGVLITLFQGIARAAIVLEGISAMAAVRRVFRLIRGRFWWSILILFVSSVLINIVASVLQYMGQFGFLGAILVAPDNMMVIAISFMVVFGLSYVVSMVLIYSYLGSVFTLLYIDMRMRREGFDLDLARAAEERAGR